MSNKTPEELAQEVSQKGSFSFIERLRGRNYPADTEVFYLDEALGYELVKLEEQAKDEVDPKKATAIEKQINDVKQKLAPSKITVHLTAIPNDRYESLLKEALVEYPREYELSEPNILGQREKTEIPNPARDERFTNALWAECIRYFEDADGNVDNSETTPATVAEMRKLMPLHAQQRVSEIIDKLRMAVAWMDYIQDEDFLAKP